MISGASRKSAEGEIGPMKHMICTTQLKFRAAIGTDEVTPEEALRRPGLRALDGRAESLRWPTIFR